MTAPALAIKKASRQAVRLKLNVQGPSGSGKTLGALALAFALAPSKKVCVIDTENESASLYADQYDFDTIALGAPYTTAKYEEAIVLAVKAGYDVLVIDSLSHQWAGPGGILARKEQMDARGGNTWTNWAPFTKEHERFKSLLMNAPIHIVSTTRSKQDYIVESGDGKKAAPRKVGLAPVQREGMEYEFSVVFELQMDHRANVSKDRTGMFDGQLIDLLGEEVGQSLNGWLSSGKPYVMPTPAELNESGATELPAPTPTPAPVPAPVAPPAPQKVGGNGSGEPMCPECRGPMYDKREGKSNPRAPDFKCKRSGCKGVYWPGQWPPKPEARLGSSDELFGGTDAEREPVGTFGDRHPALDEKDSLPF